jgi:hypothetical protein
MPIRSSFSRLRGSVRSHSSTIDSDSTLSCNSSPSTDSVPNPVPVRDTTRRKESPQSFVRRLNVLDPADPAGAMAKLPIWTAPNRYGQTVGVAIPAATENKRGYYSDPAVHDFATNTVAAVDPERKKYNRRGYEFSKHKGAHHTTRPKAKIVEVDVLAAYPAGAAVFKKRMEQSGFMDRAPLDVKYGIKTYGERRHVREQVRYQFKDRAKLEPHSEPGEKGHAKIKSPGKDWLFRQQMVHQETKLIEAKKRYEYAFKRMRTEAMAVSEHMVPAEYNATGALVTGWKLQFSSDAQLRLFFKEQFEARPAAWTKKDEIDAMVGKGLAKLTDDASSKAITHLKTAVR